MESAMESNSTKPTHSGARIIIPPKVQYNMDNKDKSDFTQTTNQHNEFQPATKDEESEPQSEYEARHVTRKPEVESEVGDPGGSGAGEKDWPVAVKLEEVSESEAADSGTEDDDTLVTVKPEVELPAARFDDTISRVSLMQFHQCPPQIEPPLSADPQKDAVVEEVNPDVGQPQQQQRKKKIELKRCRVVVKRLPFTKERLKSMGSWTVLIVPKARTTFDQPGGPSHKNRYSLEYNHWLIKEIGKVKSRSTPERDKNVQTPSYKCQLCGEVLKSDVALLLHKRVHAVEKPYKCQVCSKAFSQQGALTAHSRIHTHKRPYKCQVCASSFTQRCNLRAHCRRLHTVRMTSSRCIVCQKTFNIPVDATTRVQGHLGNKPSTCRECTVTLNKERGPSTNSGEIPYKCPVCDRNFGSAAALKVHILDHMADKPYDCPVCPKKFSELSELRAHSLTHKDQNSYRCEICPTEFSRQLDLDCHRRIHTGEKPYECQVCDMKFAYWHQLARHNRLHVEATPTRCQMPERTFSDSPSLTDEFGKFNQLVRHDRVSVEATPTRCQVPERTFSDSSNSTADIQSAAGIKLHRCRVCKMSFANSRLLTTHSKMHKGDEAHLSPVFSLGPDI